jgi:hypothetical protein
MSHTLSQGGSSYTYTRGRTPPWGRASRVWLSTHTSGRPWGPKDNEQSMPNAPGRQWQKPSMQRPRPLQRLKQVTQGASQRRTGFCRSETQLGID